MKRTYLQRQAGCEQRRMLRRQATPAEQVLWAALRHMRLIGLRVRRQHPCGPYILDFFIPSHSLAIEADGAGHHSDEGRAYDSSRTDYLNARGIRVLRFSNEQIIDHPAAVIASINATLHGLSHNDHA